jgi:hypothetical protein
MSMLVTVGFNRTRNVQANLEIPHALPASYDPIGNLFEMLSVGDSSNLSPKNHFVSHDHRIAIHERMEVRAMRALCVSGIEV